MKEIYELRVAAEHAHKVFEVAEGRNLGSVWVVKIPSNDRRLEVVGTIQRQLRRKHDFLVAGWRIIREYSVDELQEAKWLHLLPTTVIPTSGEECNTVYDESESCPSCSWGSKQVNLLSLPIAKIPKGTDISWTWGDEWVVSDRAIGILADLDPAGIMLSNVLHCQPDSDSDLISGFMQLRATRRSLRIVPPTICKPHLIDDGSEPFNGVCPLGHTFGIHLISELFLSASEQDKGHITGTVNGVGMRRGLYRPRSEIIVSQEFYRKWTEAKCCGAKFEVCRLI